MVDGVYRRHPVGRGQIKLGLVLILETRSNVRILRITPVDMESLCKGCGKCLACMSAKPLHP